MLLEDVVCKVCACSEGKLLGEDEGVVAIKEEGGNLVQLELYYRES